MRRRLAQGAAIVALTLAFAWVLGHIHWPEGVGLAMIQLSSAVGGRGIEDTEDMFMLVTLGVSLLVAVAIVAIASRRLLRRRAVARVG